MGWLRFQAVGVAETVPSPANPRRFSGVRFTLRASDVHVYQLSDDFSGVIIFLMALFSPWAFGTTQPWSIGTMNAAGFALGFFLLVKLFIRELKDYRPPRWEHHSRHSGWSSRYRDPMARLLTRTLAALTLAVLVYCVISAVNAAATYNPDNGLFEYHRHLGWLPHSLDSHRTWAAFWMYLALAGSFWGIRDWLAGMTPAEERGLHSPDERARPSAVLPRRLRRLLWLLCVNGAVLGAEAIAQRASGTNKLLFFMDTHTNREAMDQFGPYAYRSNAGQYFNLIWPLCLGFWWTLHRMGGLRRRVHHLLLLCGAAAAACPIISASRDSALVAAGMLILATGILALTGLSAHTSRRPDRRAKWGMAGGLAIFFALALGLAGYFGWDALQPRLEQLPEGLQNREAMYDAARPMARDYPLYGTGPGTFATVFRLYLVSSATYWPKQLHNDWLETRITFGWLGFALLLAALACVLLRWFAPGGIRGGRRFVYLAWLALAGCLIQALFDFPFQIYSTLFLFLLICSMLFGMGKLKS